MKFTVILGYTNKSDVSLGYTRLFLKKNSKEEEFYLTLSKRGLEDGNSGLGRRDALRVFSSFNISSLPHTSPNDSGQF